MEKEEKEQHDIRSQSKSSIQIESWNWESVVGLFVLQNNI